MKNNGLGINQKDAANSGEKHETGNVKNLSGNLHTQVNVECMHFLSNVPYIFVQCRESCQITPAKEVREKGRLVREKSGKSQGICLLQFGGHPVLYELHSTSLADTEF